MATGILTAKKAKPGMGAGVCSPAAAENFAKDNTCFSKEALLRIAHAWNTEHPDNPISGLKRKSKHSIWKDIDGKMKGICKGSGNEWCWAGKLDQVQHDNKVQSHLRPKMPTQWYKKPNTWLSNWDIQKVMRQYEDAKARFRYKFLGVLPIDFQATSEFGVCVSDEMCRLADDIPKLLKKKIQYIGMITNLDKHDEPGSHWTSLFMCIDHTKPCFGAYYYDSVSRYPPKEISEFVRGFKERIHQYLLSTGEVKTGEPFTFRTSYNTIRHQYGNSECGVFSMVYQIRWLELLEKNPRTKFEDVIKDKLTDEEMNKYYRHILFSPSPQRV